MPKIKKTNTLSKAKVDQLTCIRCGVAKSSNEFYISYNKLHDVGRLPYCKHCIQDMCLDAEGKLQIDLVKKMLKEINRPYLCDVFQTSLNTSKVNPVGVYMKNIALKDYRELTWTDSLFEDGSKIDLVSNEVVSPVKPMSSNSNKLEVTEDMVEMFGAGYTPEEYAAMWRKYLFLKNNYQDITNLHVEALVTYIRFKVKEEFATAKGEISAADKWAKLAKDAATSAKINPSQLSKADLTGGLNSFGELIKAVEQAVDVIPILPQFRFRPNDALDFVIWCYTNYVRDLKGLPAVEYKDVYKFYDKKKQEYLEQYGDMYGIFSEDTTDTNRENIEKFIAKPEKIMGADENE